jgi:hypothetical protein
VANFLKDENGDLLRLEPGIYDVPLVTEDGVDILTEDGQQLLAPNVADAILLEDGTELLNEDGTPQLLEQGGKVILEGGSSVIQADPGSYGVTGSPATLMFQSDAKLSALPTLTVQQGGANVRVSNVPVLTVVKNREFLVATDPGAYAVTGDPITTNVDLPVSPGSYATTGSAATFQVTYALSADPGTYAINGDMAQLEVGNNVRVASAPTLTVQQGGANERLAGLPAVTVQQGGAAVRVASIPVLALVLNNTNNFPALTVTY